MVYAIKTDKGVYCWFDTDKGIGGYVKDISELDNPYVFKGLLKQDARTEKTLIRMSWDMEMQRIGSEANCERTGSEVNYERERIGDDDDGIDIR